MGSTQIHWAAPGGADFAGVADGGVLARAIRTVVGFLVPGLRSFRKRMLA